MSIEALEQEIANVSTYLEHKRKVLANAKVEGKNETLIEYYQRTFDHYQGRLLGLQDALEIMMLVGTEE